MLDLDSIQFVFGAMVVLGLVHYFRTNDEVLLLILYFYYTAGLNRFMVVQEGLSPYVYVAYAYNIFSMNDELAMIALNHMLLGTGLFTVSYLLTSLVYPKLKDQRETDTQLKAFVMSNQRYIILGFVVMLIINAILLNQLTNIFNATGAMAYGVSYYLLFGFAIGGFIILLFLSYRAFTVKKGFLFKVAYTGLLVFSSYLTWDARARFRFLSWSAPLGLTVIGKMPAWKKLLIFTFGGFGATFALAISGSLRDAALGVTYSNKEIIEVAWNRIRTAEDQNMMDGYMMLYQVYPDHLPFALGMEHFEILLRPIPRAWWPDKPVGSYVNKLGLNDNMQGGSVGISPSIYGSFYAEAGVAGIVGFSIVYGIFLFRLVRWANSFASDMRFIIKGIILACLLPVLRGGDLGGIGAFVGMTYWPVIIFMYYYRNYLVKDNLIRQRIQKARKQREAFYEENPSEQTILYS